MLVGLSPLSLIHTFCSMIVVADSGSTKTDWAYRDQDGKLVQLQADGINPNYSTQEEIAETLRQISFPEPIDSIFFYGAGCSSPKLAAKVGAALGETHKPKQVTVEHDMLGAGRALFGNGSGVACILGTGSNSCLMEDGEITTQHGGDGILIGDEGSGAYLGKHLIKGVWSGNLSADIKDKLYTHLDMDRSSILERLYSQPWPNRFLASLCPFIKSLTPNEEVEQMVKACFTDLFETDLLPIKQGYDNVRAVGSVAYYFQDQLAKALSAKGCELKEVLRSPIEGLIRYHL